jgi:hypothetical protein
MMGRERVKRSVTPTDGRNPVNRQQALIETAK